MIGQTISHYRILEKIGEARPPDRRAGPNLSDYVVQAGDLLQTLNGVEDGW